MSDPTDLDPLTNSFLTLPPYIPSIAPELLPYLTPIILSASQSPNPLPEPSDPPPIKFIQTPSQGIGVVSSRNIETGECVFSDRALTIWESGGICDHRADELMELMTDEGREVLLGLARSTEDMEHYRDLNEVLQIRATNGFNVEIPSLDEELVIDKQLKENIEKGQAPAHVSILFPRISRFNHSCLPNLLHSTSFSTFAMSLIAIYPIPPSTPLSIEYTSGLLQLTRDERRAILKKLFNFTCSCDCCSLDGEALIASDTRRTKIGQLVKEIREIGLQGNRRSEVLQLFAAMKNLIREEGYRGPVEFDDPNVSKAFHVYNRMMAQRTSTDQAASDD